MRIRLAPATAALFALTVAQAQASDHDPNSGAPLPPSTKHQTTSPITDRFYVRGTYYAPHVTTLIQVNPHNAPAGVFGTTLSAERNLGLESRLNQGDFEMMFRLGQRNKIRVNWLEVDRSATHQLAQTINFGEEQFLANSLLQSQIDWRIFTMTYTYSFIRNDRVELGTGLGVHLLEAEAQTQVNATVNTQFQRQDVSGAGAFPTIPVDFAFRISQRWSVSWRGQYFHAAISNFDGWLADLHEDVQYRWKKNFAVGVGYSSTRAKLALSTGNFPGQFHVSVGGPEAFIRVSF